MGVKNVLSEAIPKRFLRKMTLSDLVASGEDTAVADFSEWYHAVKRIVALQLHKGAKAAVVAGCVQWWWKRLHILQDGGLLHLNFVLDGAPLPAKAPTSNARAAGRTKASAIVKEMEKAGSNGSAFRQAVANSLGREHWLEAAICQSFQRWSDSPDNSMRVTWERAPFEADAQIAYQVMTGVFKFAIVDDQDSLVFGASKVLFKLFYRQYGWSTYH